MKQPLLEFFHYSELFKNCKIVNPEVFCNFSVNIVVKFLFFSSIIHSQFYWSFTSISMFDTLISTTLIIDSTCYRFFVNVIQRIKVSLIFQAVSAAVRASFWICERILCKFSFIPESWELKKWSLDQTGDNKNSNDHEAESQLPSAVWYYNIWTKVISEKSTGEVAKLKKTQDLCSNLICDLKQFFNHAGDYETQSTHHVLER